MPLVPLVSRDERHFVCLVTVELGYDVQRVFGEYDPITGERLSIGDRLLAGGMLLLSIVPPAKSAGVAGKAAIKGAKAIDAASALAKVKHVVCDDKMKAIGDIAFRQTVRSPLAETARLFKKQWDELVGNVASVSWQPAYAGVGPAPRVWMSEAKDASRNMIKKVEGGVVEKGVGKSNKYDVGLYNEIKGVLGLDAHHVGQKAIMKKFIRNYDPNNAPEILVPKVGHTRKGPKGIVSRSSKGIENARQLLARDIMELRRVYPDIPNSQLRKLIELNKQLYPEIRRR